LTRMRSWTASLLQVAVRGFLAGVHNALQGATLHPCSTLVRRATGVSALMHKAQSGKDDNGKDSNGRQCQL